MLYTYDEKKEQKRLNIEFCTLNQHVFLYYKVPLFFFFFLASDVNHRMYSVQIVLLYTFYRKICWKIYTNTYNQISCVRLVCLLELYFCYVGIHLRKPRSSENTLLSFLLVFCFNIAWPTFYLFCVCNRITYVYTHILIVLTRYNANVAAEFLLNYFSMLCSVQQDFPLYPKCSSNIFSLYTILIELLSILFRGYTVILSNFYYITFFVQNT